MHQKQTAYSKNIMRVPWHDAAVSARNVPAREGTLTEKASLIGHVGMIMLSCGTTAWRVRSAMNTVARALGVTCVAEIGLITLNYTCFSGPDGCSLAISLDTIGVNTSKLHRIEQYVSQFPENYVNLGIDENHSLLDKIGETPANYKHWMLALAAAMACAGFMFNLGGGLAEIVCVFIAAGCGNLARLIAGKRKLSAMIGVVAASLTACVVYAVVMAVLRALFPYVTFHGTGYIGSVLFLVPGFPFITSILDFGKLDMRSGIERLMYSLIVMSFATMFCWAAATTFGLNPGVGSGLSLTPAVRILLRLAASFAGVIGFSMIFNSPMRMALCAAVIGSIANTLRLELVDRTSLSAIICSFIGAFLAGLLASSVAKRTGYPRVGITIPAVVVSVPGLFMYRAIYYMGTGEINEGFMFLIKAAAIVFSIGLGVLFARYITDPAFRHRG